MSAPKPNSEPTIALYHALSFSLPLTSAQQTWVPRNFQVFYSETLSELQEHASVRKYDGPMQREQPHGSGVMPYKNGDFFKGNFKQGKRHGAGLFLHRQTGLLYKGEFRDGLFSGSGLLCMPKTGEVIEGIFDQNKLRNGRVKILYASKEFFEGVLQDGKRQGKGSMTYTNGDQYEGEWNNDKRVGKGKLKIKTGGELLAQWIDDQADGNAIYDDKIKNQFSTLNTKNDVGYMKDGRLYEKCKVKFRNGDKFKGTFKDGR